MGQILELPNRITVYFQRSNGHDPDTNQKLKQRLFNNLKAGASVAYCITGYGVSRPGIQN